MLTPSGLRPGRAAVSATNASWPTSATHGDAQEREPPAGGRPPAGENRGSDPIMIGPDEAARVARQRVQRQRGPAPAGVGAPRGAGGERGRIEPDEQAVDRAPARRRAGRSARPRNPMPAAQTTHEVMASRTSRWRPRRIDTSLPATLAHVPISPMAVATTVGRYRSVAVCGRMCPRLRGRIDGRRTLHRSSRRARPSYDNLALSNQHTGSNPFYSSGS